MRLFLLLVLLSLASACERSRGPAPAATPAATGAPPTVALSGTVAEPASVAERASPSSPAPTAATTRPRSSPQRPRPAAPRTPTTARDVPDPAFDPERAPMPEARPDPDDVQALREFEAEQERRDLELLEQDTEEAALRQREEAWARERAQLARDEDDRAAIDDGFDPSREPAYDLPPEDDWQADELPPEDPYAEDGYDPDEDYRP